MASAPPTAARLRWISAIVLLCFAVAAFEGWALLSSPPITQPLTAPTTAEPLDPDAATRWAYVPAALDPDLKPSLTAAAAILVEPSTMTVLYAHREHEHRAPASTTKIVTALLALERGRLDDVVTVSRRAASVRGSSIHLRPGQDILFSDLVHGLLLRSGNDAATAIAEHVSGSQEAFVHLMNRRVHELGARNSRFENPHGLDAPGHYSTAFDLAHLARLAMTYPSFKDIVSRREYVPSDGRSWRNTNRLLWALEGIEGIKTGTTGQAGNCLVAAASRDGVRLISVVLGSRDRWSDTRRLLEWGFDAYHVMTGATADEPVAELTLKGAMDPLVAVPMHEFRFVVHDHEVAHVRLETMLNPLAPPIRKGTVVGVARAVVNDEVRREVPLVAGRDVRRWTPLGALRQWLGRLRQHPPRRSRADGIPGNALTSNGAEVPRFEQVNGAHQSKELRAMQLTAIQLHDAAYREARRSAYMEAHRSLKDG